MESLSCPALIVLDEAFVPVTVSGPPFIGSERVGDNDPLSLAQPPMLSKGRFVTVPGSRNGYPTLKLYALPKVFSEDLCRRETG